MPLTFAPEEGVAGQSNVLVTITRSDADLSDPVIVRFLTKKDADGKYSGDCGALGNDPAQLSDNEYIRVRPDPITSGARKIEAFIDILDVSTPDNLSKIFVINGDGRKFLSDECFKVTKAPQKR